MPAPFSHYDLISCNFAKCGSHLFLLVLGTTTQDTLNCCHFPITARRQSYGKIDFKMSLVTMQMSQQKKQKSCWSHPFIAFLRAANNNSLLLLQKKKKDTMILPTRKSNKSKPLSCRIVDNKSEVSWLCQYRATEELNILTLLC